MENAFALPPALAEAKAIQGLTTAPSASARQINRLIRLNFPRTASASTPSTKEILVGCTQIGKDRKGGNAAYEVELTGDLRTNFRVPRPWVAPQPVDNSRGLRCPRTTAGRAGPKVLTQAIGLNAKLVTVKGGYVPAEAPMTARYSP